MQNYLSDVYLTKAQMNNIVKKVTNLRCDFEIEDLKKVEYKKEDGSTYSAYTCNASAVNTEDVGGNYEIYWDPFKIEVKEIFTNKNIVVEKQFVDMMVSKFGRMYAEEYFQLKVAQAKEFGAYYKHIGCTKSEVLNETIIQIVMAESMLNSVLDKYKLERIKTSAVRL